MSSSAGDGGGPVTPDPVDSAPPYPPAAYPPPPYGARPPPYGQAPGYGAQPPPYGQAPPYGGYPQQPMSHPGGGYGGGMPAQRGWSGFAIGALVAGCIPWIGILAAIPLGVVALVKIGKTGQRGKPLAIVGIVISALIWVITIVLIVVVATNTAGRDASGRITKAGRIDFSGIRAGDCVQIDGLASGQSVGAFDLQGVPCSHSHNAESVGNVALSSDTYPGFDTVTREAKQACASLAKAYIDPSMAAGLVPYLFAPNESLWNSDNATHHVVCFVVRSDYSSRSGSVAK